jgi:hypothetical protein
MKDGKPTLFANEPTLIANSLQTAMWAHIQRIQSLEQPSSKFPLRLWLATPLLKHPRAAARHGTR